MEYFLLKKPLNFKQIQCKDTFKVQFSFKFKSELKISLEILWLIKNKFLINIQLIEGTIDVYNMFLKQTIFELSNIKF